MLVQQWMSQPIITVKPDSSVLDVCELFEAHQINRVPVVSNRNLMGIVCNRDVRSALPSTFQISKGDVAWKHYKKVMATELMSTPVMTISESDNIERAALIMQENKVGGLPVLAGNKTVGMLTEHDVFQAMLAITGANWEVIQLTVHYGNDNGGIKSITDEIRKFPAKILSLAISRKKAFSGQSKVSMRIHTGFIQEIMKALKSKYAEVYFNKV